MKRFIDPILLLLKNHYNNTESREIYNIETNQFETITYKESMKDIIAVDMFTFALLYYILNHL
mgnify:CR=1 FL=1